MLQPHAHTTVVRSAILERQSFDWEPLRHMPEEDIDGI